MHDNEIKRGRHNYQTLRQGRDKLLKIIEQLQKLEQDENVMKYRALLSELGIETEIEEEDRSDRKLAVDAFDTIAANTECSNRIYVFIGPNGEPTSYAYRDLETGDIKSIYNFQKEEFEARHNVIKPTCEDKLKFYDELRREFFLSLTVNTQKQAIQKVLIMANNQ